MKDLLKLYSFESVHDTPDEKAIADWICKWLDTRGVKYNRLGDNIYKLDNSQAPILSAHLDQVKTNGKAVKFFQKDDGSIIAFNDKWQRTSLGADDKNGIWIILKCLEEATEDFNFIISAGEEVGLVGIDYLEKNKVLDKIDKDYQWCIVLDRKGNTDVLKSGSGTSFCNTLAQDLVNYWRRDYVVTTGGLSDTKTICKYCEAVNMSVAYTSPHTMYETTDFNRLTTIKNDVLDMVEDFVHYPSLPVNETKTWSYNYGKY